MATDIAKAQKNQEIQQVTTPATLLQMAVEQNADIEKLEKLMALQERWEATEAKKAFVRAMAGFRESCPAISKTRMAHNSKYAGLAETIDAIKQSLSDYGLSHTWRTDQSEGRISVTCCVTHVMGHSECTTLEGPPDTSGSKNNIQAIGSTIAYLERYTLFAILGLASSDMDSDGGKPVPLITDDQARELEARITDNDINMEAVKKWMRASLKVEHFADLNEAGYKAVMHKVDATIKAKK